MKILFVDDEIRVLEALERSLEMIVDDDWQLEFVNSGAAALARMAEEDFDVVVTDMRMPGIDGAELLARARELAPRTVRIVLSGQMEASNALRAMERAHQILGKPCRAELVLDVLRSSTRFRTMLDDEPFRRAVISIDRLPAAPSTYREIQAELARSNASAATVAAIVAKDPGLTARMLQVANSPFFGGARRIDDVRNAISRLGLQMISALALGAIFDESESSSHELDLGALARSGLHTATLTARLAPSEGQHAYLAGMLSEVGRVVFAVTDPRRFDRGERQIREHARSIVEVEREIWGVGHAEVGAYLLAVWGLPDGVVDAVCGHHRPLEALLEAGAAPLTIATAVAAQSGAGETIAPETLARCGIAPELLEAAIAEAA